MVKALLMIKLDHQGTILGYVAINEVDEIK
jgi:hypothetical protein